MPTYTPWTWSAPHLRHYSYLIADDGATILDTLWAGPVASPASGGPDPLNSTAAARDPRWSQNVAPLTQQPPLQAASPPHRHYTHQAGSATSDEHAEPTNANKDEPEVGEENAKDEAEADEDADGRIDTPNRPRHSSLSFSTNSNSPAQTNPPFGGNRFGAPPPPPQYPYSPSNSQFQSQRPPPRPTIDVLPPDVQANLGYKNRRFIQTDNGHDAEHLDARYRRVVKLHHPIFFTPGRVFKMLWTEPAGQANPGRTRNSTHFSMVLYGEQVYSEIRRFIVVRNKGTFSQCIPIQTYRGRGATKPGLVMHDHGVIHTTKDAPNLMPGENLTKYSIRVEPTGTESLEAESRVNYGKAYAVEHNVKVLDIGMVVEGHRYLIETYFDSAMRGQ